MLSEQPSLGGNLYEAESVLGPVPTTSPAVSCLLSVLTANPSQVWTNQIRCFLWSRNKILLGSGFSLLVIMLWKIQGASWEEGSGWGVPRG